MLKQLLPILALSGVFGIYGLVQLARYCFWQTMPPEPESPFHQPESPFHQMIANAKASEPDYKGNDLNNV